MCKSIILVYISSFLVHLPQIIGHESREQRSGNGHALQASGQKEGKYGGGLFDEGIAPPAASWNNGTLQQRQWINIPAAGGEDGSSSGVQSMDDEPDEHALLRSSTCIASTCTTE